MTTKITQFRETYYFLSNMFPTDISFEGFTYPSSETAFQAAKCLNKEDRKPFLHLNGYQAKKKGRRVSLRPDWESVKVDIMYQILKQKFHNPSLKQKLLDTKDAELIEGNTWGDTFWGVDIRTGIGENHLGKLLMKIRQELKGENL